MDRLKQWAKALRREAHALYLAARDPRTPWLAKVLALAIAAYALSPIDLIPDFIPVLGLLDEVILLPLAIAGVLKLVPRAVMDDCRARAAEAAARPVSRAAAAAMVLVWIVALGLSGWFAWRWLAGGT